MFCAYIKLGSVRTLIDVGRGKDGGGRGSDVMFVPRDVGGQSHWHPSADSRTRPVSVQDVFREERPGVGGKSVLR